MTVLFKLVKRLANMFCWGGSKHFTIGVQKSSNNRNAFVFSSSTPIKYMRC